MSFIEPTRLPQTIAPNELCTADQPHMLDSSDQESDDSISGGSFSSSSFSSSWSSHPFSRTFAVLRWPILVMVGSILVLELFAYFVVRQFVVLYERLFVWTGVPRRLRHNLINASSYDEWLSAAATLDSYMGRATWKKLLRSEDYDYRLVRAIYRKLRLFRTGTKSRHSASRTLPPSNLPKLASLCLESACKPNIGGIDNQRLYSKCYMGTKTLIENYKEETRESLDSLLAANIDPTDPHHSWESKQAKFSFFTKAAQLYGVTALCLSGGASFGFHHLGVIKALWKSDALPKIISGTSAGSLIASIICCRTDAELDNVLDAQIYQYLTACDDPWLCRIRRLMKEGVMFSLEKWEQKTSWMTCGDLTFLEAYEKTGRILNISVVSAGAAGSRSHQRCLNYKTAPNIIISSAVLASSAVPGIIAAVRLKMKHTDPAGNIVIETFNGWGDSFQDGSLKMDVPFRELHQLFNVNFSIVSQVNPHIAIFFYQAQGGYGAPVAHRGGRGWRGGFIMSTLEHFLKLELRKWLSVMRDLRLLPSFLNQDWDHVWLQKFHGDVNILPIMNLSDFILIIEDPTRERMQSYFDRGQRSAFPKLAMIKSRLAIERKINYFLGEQY